MAGEQGGVGERGWKRPNRDGSGFVEEGKGRSDGENKETGGMILE